MKPPPMSAEQFLATYAAPVRQLALAARERILAVVPEATERVRPGWKLIGYNAPAYFAFIAPQQDHVRIGFEWGVLLSDPAGLLQGSGSQVRYVHLHTRSDLRSRALPELLRTAAALRPPRASRSLSSIFGVVLLLISAWKPDTAPQAMVMNRNG